MHQRENSKWQKRYTPPTRENWSGRGDSAAASYFHQIVECVDLIKRPVESLAHNFAIVGFSSDEGVRRNRGRVGAAEGPKALRQALGPLPFNGEGALSFADCGDIICSDGDLEGAQLSLASLVEELLRRQIFPLIVGGGHEVAWGSYCGALRALEGTNIGIVNFDAHYDIRVPLEGGEGSSGTPFYQMKMEREKCGRQFNYLCIGLQRYGNSRELIDRAEKWGVTSLSADELVLEPMARHIEKVRAFFDRCDRVVLSICLDLFSAAVAPGVSAPQPLGLLPWQVLPLIRECVRSEKLLYLEIAELSPKHDRDMQTAKLAAALLCDAIHHLQGSHIQSLL